MKTLLTCFCFLITLTACAQSDALIDSINKVIGPGYQYSYDTTDGYNTGQFVETDLFGNTTNEVIVLASSTNEDDETHKLFVLAKKEKQWVVIDSSQRYGQEDFAVHVQIGDGSITFSHRFAHGMSEAEYAFDSTHKYFKVIHWKYAYSRNNIPDKDHMVEYEQQYDVNNKQLSLHVAIYSNESEGEGIERNKILHKVLPPGTSLRLSKVRYPTDPLDVFIDSGPVYDALMRLK